MAYSAAFLIHPQVPDATTGGYGPVAEAVQPSWLGRMMATVELCQFMAPAEGPATDAARSANELRLAIEHRCQELVALLKE